METPPPAVGTGAAQGAGAEAGDVEAPVWRLASGSSATDDEASRIFFLFVVVLHPPCLFDLGSLGVATLIPPHLGLGACLLGEGNIMFVEHLFDLTRCI